MFCPGCGTQTNETLKFCKQCGANLASVRQALNRPARVATAGFDWSKTWVAEMFLTEEERQRQRGITPEEKRLNEIKGGVITSFVGIGVMIFLYFLLGAVAAQEDPEDAEIIRHVWLVGLIPFLVGLGIIFNGYFISRRIVELKREQEQLRSQQLRTPSGAQLSETAGPPLSNFSVVEQTTRHIPESIPSQERRDSD